MMMMLLSLSLCIIKKQHSKKKKKSNIPSPSENKTLTLVGLHMLQPGIWGGVWILVGQLLHSVQDNSDPQEGTQIPNVFEGDELNTDP